jgi:LysM repeat protein
MQRRKALLTVLALVCNGTITLDTKTQTYTITTGDTLTSIAKKFNRGIYEIAKVNSTTNVNVINNGAVLTIPAQVCLPDSTSCLVNSPAAPTAATCILGGPGFYVVASGDTLTAIAASYQITYAALIAANSQITNPDLILVGQVINVPVCAESSCTIAPYTIKSGDIFFDLAAKFSSTVGQLLALNTGTEPGKLQIGQSITLASACKSA